MPMSMGPVDGAAIGRSYVRHAIVVIQMAMRILATPIQLSQDTFSSNRKYSPNDMGSCAGDGDKDHSTSSIVGQCVESDGGGEHSCSSHKSEVDIVYDTNQLLCSFPKEQFGCVSYAVHVRIVLPIISRYVANNGCNNGQYAET